MRKHPQKNHIVENLSKICEYSVHDISRTPDTAAHTYHYHDTVEVIIAKCGWADGLIGDMTGKLQQGMVVVLGSNLPHCVLRCSDDCSLLLVHIPCELLKWDEERFPEMTHGIEFLRLCESGIAYNNPAFADKIARLAGRIAAAEGFLRMSLLMRMLHILSTTPPSYTLKAEQHISQGRDNKETPIDKAYQYIYKHFREQLSLNELAAHAGLNPSALCRAFKKSSGHTIGQFCNRLRIEYACNMLLTTNMDIAQIAYMSGYNSYPHFCTQFKKAMKISPSEYREITGRRD